EYFRLRCRWLEMVIAIPPCALHRRTPRARMKRSPLARRELDRVMSPSGDPSATRNSFGRTPSLAAQSFYRLREARRKRANSLLADAEPGENPSQQIIRGELAGDLAQGVLRGAQLLGDQLPGTVLGELARGFFGVLARPREGLQVPAARADRPRIHGLIPHALLQLRAPLVQPPPGERRQRDVRRAGERVGDRQADREIALVEHERDRDIRRQPRALVAKGRGAGILH